MASTVFLQNQYKFYRYLYNKCLMEKVWGQWDLWPDRLLVIILRNQYRYYSSSNFRMNYRLNFFKKGFYTSFINHTPLSFIKNNLNVFLAGWRYFFQLFSKWFLPLGLTLTYVYYTMYMQYLPAARIAFVWISLFSILYLLISGFVFFFKKYQYGKFTSVIQRFWKRSLILFWLIEGTLLIVFFYLTLNSTWYLYNVSDQAQVFRGFFFSWRIFLLKIIPNTLLILLTTILLLNNKWQTISKNTLLVITITTLVIYITWIEFYQYYHLINYFHGKTWFYTKEQVEWTVEQDLKKTLSSKNLLNIMLILKFWHVLFVAGMWIFFVLRSFESDRIRYPLIAGNLLNFIMLYILTWVHMYPWFKFFPRKYAAYSYKWFYQNNRTLGVRLFFNDLQLFFISLSDFKFIFTNYFTLNSFNNTPFYLFKPSNVTNGFVDFNKRFAVGQILNELIYLNKDYAGSLNQFKSWLLISKNVSLVLWNKFSVVLDWFLVNSENFTKDITIYRNTIKGILLYWELRWYLYTESHIFTVEKNIWDLSVHVLTYMVYILCCIQSYFN